MTLKRSHGVMVMVSKMAVIIVARYQGAGPSLMALSATLIAVLAGKVCYCSFLDVLPSVLIWTSSVRQRNCGSRFFYEILSSTGLKVIQD